MKNYSYICKCDKYRKKEEYKILVEKWKLEENSHLLHPFLFSTHKYIKKGENFPRRKCQNGKWKFFTRGKKSFFKAFDCSTSRKKWGISCCMYARNGKIIIIDTHNTGKTFLRMIGQEHSFRKEDGGTFFMYNHHHQHSM